MYNVLIVSPGRANTAGITPVVRMIEESFIWDKYKCYWVETAVNKKLQDKLIYFLSSLFVYIAIVPFAKVVHIHLSEPNSALRKSIYLYIAKIFGKKTIIHFHAFSLESTIYGKNKERYRKIFKLCDSIVVVSNYWSKNIEGFIGDHYKIRVIYNSCKTLKEKSLLDENKREKLILYIGTINMRKGYADLIYAFSELVKNNSDWRLVLIGGGEIDEANRIINNCCLGESVDLMGYVDEIVKQEYLSKASIFCLPTYAEGFPMAIVEAMSYSLPIITTPVGGIPDICENMNNSLLYNPGNIDDLKKCLGSLINNEVLRSKLSQNAYKTAINKFNVDCILAQFCDLYDELIK